MFVWTSEYGFYCCLIGIFLFATCSAHFLEAIIDCNEQANPLFYTNIILFQFVGFAQVNIFKQS